MVTVRSLTYKLRKIQREQSVSQRKQQKKKGLRTLTETIVEKKFKIAKQMKAENCDVVDDKCVKNNAENDAY